MVKFEKMEIDTRSKNELDNEEQEKMLDVLDKKVCFCGECTCNLFDMDLNNRIDDTKDKTINLENRGKNISLFSFFCA